MSITLFNTHTLAGRTEIVWAHGAFIAKRCRRGYCIKLYSLGNFFAEVWSNPANDTIVLIRALHSKKALEPYTTKIKLTDMYYW